MPDYRADNYRESAVDQLDGILFEKLPQQYIQEVTAEVAQMAARLETSPPPVVAPPKGVLKNSLNPEQKKRLNLSLSERYAARNLAERTLLAQVPIHEKGEQMVSLPVVLNECELPAAFSQRHFEEVCGPYAHEQRIFYVRRRVAYQMAQAMDALNAIGLTGYIEDAWRPELVQATLFVRRVRDLAEKHDNWQPDEVQMIAGSLTAPSPGMAGHQAGAAVDWRIAEVQGRQRRLLDLGNGYPEGTVLSSIDCPYVSAEQWRTRTLFASVAKLTNLKLLRTENWHMSARDRGMGIDPTVHPAEPSYGPVTDFNRRTGELQKSEAYNVTGIDTPYLSLPQIQVVVDLARKRKSYRDIFREILAKAPEAACQTRWLDDYIRWERKKG